MVRPDADELVSGLNPAQREAVTHRGGPLLVVAGAGSGKTRVLTHRIAWLIVSEGLSPFEILAITFTNKAAAEMRQRVGALVGPVAEKMWVSTFHAACVRILRRDGKRLGYPSVVHDLRPGRRRPAHRLRRARSRPRRQEVRPPLGPRHDLGRQERRPPAPTTYAERAFGPFEKRIAQVFVEYQARLQRAGAMDFDDLLAQTVELLRRDPEVLAHYRERFRHVLVDEYQDTNPVQNELVVLLGSEHRNVFVVGDSDQGIYGFRGADVRNILEFERAFPDATVVVLDQNYRSTQTILDAANAVIANNLARKPKELWTDQGHGERIVRYHAEDEVDEARWVCRELARLHDGATPLGRDGGLLPHQRPVPGARGPADAGGHPLQGRGRHPLLRPPRGQGRARLRAGRRQPRRRGVAQAGAQRAQARHRRHHRDPPRPVRPGARAAVRRRPAPGRRRSACRRRVERAVAGFVGAARRAGRAGRRRARSRCSRRRWSARVRGRAAGRADHRRREPAGEPGRAGRRGAGLRDRRRLPGAGGPGVRHRRARLGGRAPSRS